MTELEIDVSFGPIRPIPVPGFIGANRVMSGRARLHGWGFRETGGVPDEPPAAPDAATAAIVAAAAGNVAIPAGASLTGFDINLSTVGTAAMTVTVTNVPNGPYTYILPAGQTRLTVSFPVALPATAGQPTVSWTATAAAVGTIVAYGVTSGGGAGSASIVEITSGGNVIGEAKMDPGGVHNAWFGGGGILIEQDITLHGSGGIPAGVIYVSYYRE